MCSFAIRQTGISRVVFGISNNRIGGMNSKFAVLTDASFHAKFPPPEIQAGILTEDCKNLWRDFQQKTSRSLTKKIP
jgi:tRNA(Arg) A34 adenosine deaminase TadA